MNPEAVQSIDFFRSGIGMKIGGATTNGNSGFALPYTDPQLYRQYFDFDETLPSSPFPRSAADTLTKRLYMSLRPYHGIYLYNLNPVSGQRVPMSGTVGRKAYDISRRQIVPGQGGPMNDIRLMMIGGNMGGSFKCNFNQIFSLQYWNFRQRRTTNKTLATLSAYGNSEQKKGRYEYFQISNEEYRMEFTGKDSIRSRVEAELQSTPPVTRGLLYFRYTEMGRGTFTYYLPNGNNKHGTFSTNGRRYVLSYEGQEIIITLERWGGSFYTLRRDLTQQWRSEYNVQELEKVQIALDVMRIFWGQDR